MCAGGSAAQRYAEPRRGCTKSAPRPPGGQVSYQRGRLRNNVSNVAGRSFTSASGSRSRSTAGHRKPGPGHRDHRVRVRTSPRLDVSPAGRSTPNRRTASDVLPARPPRRRRHHLRSPGTSLATAAARRPQSAPGIPSTVPVSSPARGMHRRKMSTDQPLVAHRLPSLTSRPAAARPLSAQPVGPPVYARRTVLDVVWCAFAMPPSRFSRRCLVLLLLVAVATGVLARAARGRRHRQ